MWVKQCHKPSPSHHHFYRWYKPCIPKWVVYDIVLTTLYQQIKGRNDEFRSTRTAIAVRIGKKMKKMATAGATMKGLNYLSSWLT